MTCFRSVQIPTYLYKVLGEHACNLHAVKWFIYVAKQISKDVDVNENQVQKDAGFWLMLIR